MGKGALEEGPSQGSPAEAAYQGTNQARDGARAEEEEPLAGD